MARGRRRSQARRPRSSAERRPQAPYPDQRVVAFAGDRAPVGDAQQVGVVVVGQCLQAAAGARARRAGGDPLRLAEQVVRLQRRDDGRREGEGGDGSSGPNITGVRDQLGVDELELRPCVNEF